MAPPAAPCAARAMNAAPQVKAASAAIETDWGNFQSSRSAPSPRPSHAVGRATCTGLTAARAAPVAATEWMARPGYLGGQQVSPVAWDSGFGPRMASVGSHWNPVRSAAGISRTISPLRLSSSSSIPYDFQRSQPHPRAWSASSLSPPGTSSISGPQLHMPDLFHWAGNGVAAPVQRAGAPASIHGQLTDPWRVAATSPLGSPRLVAGASTIRTSDWQGAAMQIPDPKLPFPGTMRTPTIHTPCLFEWAVSSASEGEDEPSRSFSRRVDSAPRVPRRRKQAQTGQVPRLKSEKDQSLQKQMQDESLSASAARAAAEERLGRMERRRQSLALRTREAELSLEPSTPQTPMTSEASDRTDSPAQATPPSSRVTSSPLAPPANGPAPTVAHADAHRQGCSKVVVLLVVLAVVQALAIGEITKTISLRALVAEPLVMLSDITVASNYGWVEFGANATREVLWPVLDALGSGRLGRGG